MTSFLARNLSPFRLITFDVTDTLLRFSKPPPIQYKETAEEFGITTLDETRLLSSFKPCFKEHSAKYPNYGCGSDINWNTWWTQLVCNVLNASSTDSLDQQKVMSTAKKLVQLYETPKCYDIFDGGAELVLKIQQTEKCVGVISNFDPRLRFLLRNMGLKNFNFVLTSYEAKTMKPNQGIFDRALKMSNLRGLEPKQALHIGNQHDVDYMGARNAGWSGALISNETVECKHKFSSLKEFLNVLETKEFDFS